MCHRYIRCTLGKAGWRELSIPSLQLLCKSKFIHNKNPVLLISRNSTGSLSIQHGSFDSLLFLLVMNFLLFLWSYYINLFHILFLMIPISELCVFPLTVGCDSPSPLFINFILSARLTGLHLWGLQSHCRGLKCRSLERTLSGWMNRIFPLVLSTSVNI